ncbi:MAG: helix-turn-helix domain-containing protein [Melioribacteraceae bacterium]|nr:helix-turn-helix domain-containing protein [Melioribacteraceae bacterium]
MPSIIDLSKITPDVNNDHYLTVQQENISTPPTQEPSLGRITQDENERMLQRIYPDKLLFTIQETAALLNVSHEFVRQQIIKNIIPAVGFGDRRMINRSTIIQLLTFGV